MSDPKDFDAKKESFIKSVEEKGYADVVKEMEGIWSEAQKTAKDFADK
ncbi:hypothetical protein [Blautia sp. LMAG:75]|nr:hypothetical protein [Blautia sp. LMAG:75]